MNSAFIRHQRNHIRGGITNAPVEGKVWTRLLSSWESNHKTNPQASLVSTFMEILVVYGMPALAETAH